MIAKNRIQFPFSSQAVTTAITATNSVYGTREHCEMYFNVSSRARICFFFLPLHFLIFFQIKSLGKSYSVLEQHFLIMLAVNMCSGGDKKAKVKALTQSFLSFLKLSLNDSQIHRTEQSTVSTVKKK